MYLNRKSFSVNESKTISTSSYYDKTFKSLMLHSLSTDSIDSIDFDYVADIKEQENHHKHNKHSSSTRSQKNKKISNEKASLSNIKSAW